MNTLEKSDEIIDEFRQSRQQIRKLIQEYEDQEKRLFAIMCNKIKRLNEIEDSRQIAQRSKLDRSLE